MGVGVIVGGQTAVRNQAIDVRSVRAAYDRIIVGIFQNHDDDVLNRWNLRTSVAASATITSASATVVPAAASITPASARAGTSTRPAGARATGVRTTRARASGVGSAIVRAS